MKHWLCQYEARAIARMKRSAHIVSQCAEGTLHSRRRLHSSCTTGALHCNQNEKADALASAFLVLASCTDLDIGRYLIIVTHIFSLKIT